MRNLIILALIGLLLAAPVTLLLASQQSVQADVIAAAERGDVQALAARVDFDKLRVFLKHDLKAKKADTSPIGAAYANAGPAAANIDQVVDYYVQPENIAILYAMRQSAFENIPVERFIVRQGLSPVYGFQMTFGLPPEALPEGAARVAAERFQVRAVFRLSGLTWKVHELHVPLFMVPKHTYSQPAVDIFAPAPRR